MGANMRNSAELEARVREMVAAALGPTFNVEGHAKMLANLYASQSLDVIRRLIVYEVRARKGLAPS